MADGIGVVDTTESEGFSPALGLCGINYLSESCYRFGMHDAKGHVRHTFTVAMQLCFEELAPLVAGATHVPPSVTNS
jgi:hypothetical protein